MRLNVFIAQATGMSRRAADRAIEQGRVSVNNVTAITGLQVSDNDLIALDNKPLRANKPTITIILNKPIGYVCSRNGQGSKTIYELLPSDLRHLKPVGRLDKDSSGLLLLTNDGKLAHELTHPSYKKIKQYQITLNKPLEPLHQQMINDYGITLEDGLSRLQLTSLDDDRLSWQVTMREGRNRQIRRTFNSLGYEVTTLHRTILGPYSLESLQDSLYCAI
jgi:23S rRNA pseudouridine2605 synthase